MFIRTKIRSNGKKVIQIVENYRLDGKTRQKVIRHVGQPRSDKEVNDFIQLAKKILHDLESEQAPDLFDIDASPKHFTHSSVCEDKVQIKNLREEHRVIDGIGDIFGHVYDTLGFDRLLGGTRKDAQWNAVLKSSVLSRLLCPSSKRKSVSLLKEDLGIDLSLDKIYRMMDHVASQEEHIQTAIRTQTLDLFSHAVDVLFFDVTTLYFESIRQDDLRDFGFSKDCKFKETQVVLALMTTTDGFPFGYKLFPGNMYEGHTLIHMIEHIKTDYRIEHVVLVADRAMFTDHNLRMLEEEGITYIVAAKLKSLSREIQQLMLSSHLYTPCVISNEFQWVREYMVKEKRRLIVSYSAKRAHKDASDRKRLIERLLKKVKKGKVTLKKLIPNYGSSKYVTITQGHAEVNQDKIKQDAQWDGIHGVITNSIDASVQNILTRYRELWSIEAAFRVQKHQLKMRPIFHWTPKRIRAHVTLCFIAYTTVIHTLHQLNHHHGGISFETLKELLSRVQTSTIRDTKTNRKYAIPSVLNETQKNIYNAFGIKRSEVPVRVA